MWRALLSSIADSGDDCSVVGGTVSNVSFYNGMFLFIESAQPDTI